MKRYPIKKYFITEAYFLYFVLNQGKCMSWKNLLKHCKLSVVKKLVYTIDKSGFYLSEPMQNKGLASELENFKMSCL